MWLVNNLNVLYQANIYGYAISVKCCKRSNVTARPTYWKHDENQDEGDDVTKQSFMSILVSVDLKSLFSLVYHIHVVHSSIIAAVKRT